jgi:hypothetical protein
MKGIIIRSFVEFVEETYGETEADEMLSVPGLTSAGGFTNIGYYPTDDLMLMLGAISGRTGAPVGTMVRDFGADLYGRLHRAHAGMLARFASPIDLLASLEAVIHVNVRKLYSEAELPRFDVLDRDGDRSITLRYRSVRPLADLAEGLIAGCLDQYGLSDRSSVERYESNPDGTEAKFRVIVHEREASGGDEDGRRVRAPATQARA